MKLHQRDLKHIVRDARKHQVRPCNIEELTTKVKDLCESDPWRHINKYEKRQFFLLTHWAISPNNHSGWYSENDKSGLHVNFLMEQYSTRHSDTSLVPRRIVIPFGSEIGFTHHNGLYVNTGIETLLLPVYEPKVVQNQPNKNVTLHGVYAF